jgi:hypothetical protein
MPWMIPQMFTPITNSQSPCGTSVICVPCIGTPALLQAMWSLPKLRRLPDRGFLDVGHDHVGAGLRERGRDAESDA